MARGRKSTPKRRGSRGINILRAGYAVASTELTMRAVSGTGIMGFLTGKADIRPPVASYTGSATYANPDQIVTLNDFMADPSNSLMEMGSNLKANAVPLVVGSMALNIGFKLGKKLLAPQRREANYLLRTAGLKGVAHF